MVARPNNGLVTQRLSEFDLALTFLDLAAGSGRDGHEIERHHLDLARECVRRLVIRADRRARIHADVERFVGREAAGNSLVHPPLTDLSVVDIELDLATFSDATVGHKYDAYGGRSFR